MSNKTNTRVTIDIPTADHKKLKMLAAFHGKSMREIFIELIEHGLENYQECPEEHAHNETTKKALANAGKKTRATTAKTVEELFKKLNE